jgi:hypothetical protein
MVIRQSTTHAYYPLPDQGPGLMGGSGRIRYVRGFLVVNPKRSGAVIGSRGRPGHRSGGA